MKNLLLGLALVAGICSCSTQKDSMSDATPATGMKADCTGACEAGKEGCCSEKAKEGTCSEKAKEGTCSETKVCPMTGKVQG